MGPTFQYEVAGASNVLTVSSPIPRQVVQRGGLGRADLGLQGIWSGIAAQLQARAVVMAGNTNNGASTDWAVIANSPSNEAGFAFMWHSHNEREITTNNVFPGGMLMMMLVDSREFVIDESN